MLADHLQCHVEEVLALPLWRLRQWIAYLNEQDIRISMDGKGRAIDNIFIERFWRTLKFDYVYLHPATDGLELYQGIKQYIHYYNHELHHQGIDRKVPAELYQSAA